MFIFITLLEVWWRHKVDVLKGQKHMRTVKRSPFIQSLKLDNIEVWTVSEQYPTRFRPTWIDATVAEKRIRKGHFDEKS